MRMRMRRAWAGLLLATALLALPHGDARVQKRARETKTRIADAKESRAREAAEAPVRAAAEAKRQAAEDAVAARQRDAYSTTRQLQEEYSTTRKLQESGDSSGTGDAAGGAGTDDTAGGGGGSGGGGGGDDGLAASEGAEFNADNYDLLDTGMDGWEAAQLRSEVYGQDGFSWYDVSSDELHSQAPAEIARVDNLALAQLVAHPPPGYQYCACHNNPYMLYSGNECFDPWHLAVLPSCPRLCSCHGPVFEISPAIGMCVNETAAEAANASLSDTADAATMRGFADTKETCVSGAQAQCVDDVNWYDQDGDGCAAYATFADPAVACNYDGYTEALTHCPVTCGSCELLGLSNSTSAKIDTSLYSRMYHAYPGQRHTCGLRNNLGTPENEFLSARIRVPGPKTTERCAAACFEYIVDGIHACKSFAIGSVVNEAGEDEIVCEFSDDCDDRAGLIRTTDDEPWDTYLLAKGAHECDPTPTSPLVEDECGVCGGDGTTCKATLEILSEEPLEEPGPSLGSIVANGKYMFGDQRRVDQDVNCTRTPFAVACREEYLAQPVVRKTDEEILADLPKIAVREGKYSTVYMYLRLTGSKGASAMTLLSYGRPDLMFGFGSHPGGQVANFSMAFPHGDDLGVIERAQVFLIGGDHWLAGKDGKKFRGIRLRMTINLRVLEWVFQLQQPLQLDPDTDVMTIVDWQFADRAQLPTAIQRCHMDCSRDTGHGTPYSQHDPVTLDRTGEAEAPTFHSASTPRGNPKYPDELDLDLSTGPWPVNLYQGCQRICTKTYEMNEPQVWPVKSANRRKISDCIPAFHAVCPIFSEPVCGEDGRTYQNECVLAAHCVREIHRGDCVKGEKIDLMARVLYAPGRFKSSEQTESQNLGWYQNEGR